MKLTVLPVAVRAVLASVRAQAPSAEPSAELPIILGLLQATPDLSTLLAASQAVNLVGPSPLTTNSPITVFAPTNEAFAGVLTSLGITPAQILADPKVLQALLLNHVVAGSDPTSSLQDGQTLTTLLGGQLHVKVVGNAVTLVSDTGRSATVVQANIPASNGIVHVVSGVLTPNVQEAAASVPAAELASVVLPGYAASPGAE